MVRPKETKQKETKKVISTVHLELYEAIEDLAARQGRTVSSLVAFILEHYMAHDAPKFYPLNKVGRQYEE